MVALFAPEKDIKNEPEILVRLFDSGLLYFHLRKPEMSKEELIKYLDKIPTPFHNRIMIHQHHQLCNQFDLLGIHLKEQTRLDLKDELQEYINGFRKDGKLLSSSFHDPEELKSCKINFDYLFLSPLFNSISKKGYHGKEYNVSTIDNKVIGLGGVTDQNIDTAKKLGYKGVGVLGYVWYSKNPITAFSKILKRVKELW
ncbi:MAG: thiamine phosphate synthase [Bacteroidota bacterium]